MIEEAEQGFHDEMKEVWRKYESKLPAGTLCGIIMTLSANWTFESAPTLRVAEDMLQKSILVMKGKYLARLKLKENNNG